MDITGVLYALQNANNEARASGEMQLKQLETQNIAMYMAVLINEVSGEEKPAQTRTLAAIMLKNALWGVSAGMREEHRVRWLNLDYNVRNDVKNKALLSLATSAHDVRTQVSVLIAKLANIELGEKTWDDLIPQLTNVDLEDKFKFVALDTLSYVCEDADPLYLAPYSTMILRAVCDGMDAKRPVEIRCVATRALSHSLDFIDENFQNDEQRNYIMDCIFQAAMSESAKLRLVAFETIVSVASLYYEKLEPYLQTLWMLTSTVILKDEDAVGKEAVEFWCTVCETEIEIQENIASSRITPLYIMKKAASMLTDVLFEGCTKQDEVYDESSFNVAMACGECLKLMAICVKNDAFPLYMDKVTKHYNDPNWRFREAAALIFGSVLDGPDNAVLSQQNYLQSATKICADLVRSDNNIAVRDTAAWALKRVCEFHCAELPFKFFEDEILNTAGQGLTQVPRVAAHCAATIQKIAENCSERLQGRTAQVLEALFICGNRQDADENNLRNAAYEAINGVLAGIDENESGLIMELVKAIATKLMNTLANDNNNSQDQQTIQALLIGCLNTACRKAGRNIQPYAENILQLFLRCLNSKNASIHHEAFLAFGTLINCLEQDFLPFLSPFLPVLIQALQNIEDYSVCSAAVGCVADLSRAMDVSMAEILPQIMPILENDLSNKHLDKWVKPVIISTYGDIALAIGSTFVDYVHRVMIALTAASQLQFDLTNIEWIEYQNTLFQSIFDAVSGIVQGLADVKGRYQDKHAVFEGYLEWYFMFLQRIAMDENSTLDVMVSSIHSLGDVSQYFRSVIQGRYNVPWMTNYLKKSLSTFRDNDKDLWAFEFINKCIKFQ